MSRHTTAHVKSRTGEMVLQDHQTDAPLLPIASIERLHQMRPDKVDWIFEQTQREAEYRRLEHRRTNLFIFIERMVGMFFALAMGVIGIVGGLYAAIQGHEWLGGIVATATIGTLAGNFLIQRKK
jgi:hypothetical protein